MATAHRSSVVQVERDADGVLRVDDEALRRMSRANAGIATDLLNAKNATNKEHEMSIADAVKLYKKGIVFSLFFSLAVVMEGYDLSVIGSFYGFPAFKDRYGTQPDPTDGGKVVSAPWQTGLSNGSAVGSIIGLYINGVVSERFGCRKTMMVALTLMIAFIFLPFFAHNIQTLLAGEILCGIPWGIFQTLTTTYAAEIMPTVLRAYLTTYVNLCWVFGQLIAAGVLRGLLHRTDQWAYRIPFALQWIWPPIVLTAVILAPESPWWLVRQGRLDDAKKALRRLTSANSGVPFDVDDQVQMMKATNELELVLAKGASYWDCFRGLDLRRTEIASLTWVAQAWCGGALMGYSVQFYQRAGLSDDSAFDLNIGQYCMGAVGTIGAWFLMPWFGRRTLYLAGLFILFVLLMIVGGLGTMTQSTGASWAIGSILLVYTFVYDITVGPVCYSVVAEIPSTRLKIKTVVLARNFYNIAGIINNILMPRMLGLNSWNWGAKTGFFWAGACLILFVWTYFRMPEPKDRTYGELDVLFENKVSARKFHKTRVDQFAGAHTEVVAENSDTDVEKAVYEHKG